MAAPVSVGLARDAKLDPLAWLALTGAACLLERATGRAAEHLNPPPESEQGQGATIYELLRPVA